jgi:hypothetical protein
VYSEKRSFKAFPTMKNHEQMDVHFKEEGLIAIE